MLQDAPLFPHASNTKTFHQSKWDQNGGGTNAPPMEVEKHPWFWSTFLAWLNQNNIWEIMHFTQSNQNSQSISVMNKYLSYHFI